MNKTELPKLVELVALMVSAFGKEADEATYLRYEFALNDLPIEAIERGIRRSLRECKFLPTGAELRELCGEVRDTDRAVLAFAALSQAVQHHGYYGSVTFDDPLINAAINNLGGWERICSIEGQEEWESWFRKDFERVYVALCRTGASQEACSPLLGHYDRQNGLLGYERSQPALVRTGLPPPRPGLVHHAYETNGGDVPRIDFKRPEDS